MEFSRPEKPSGIVNESADPVHTNTFIVVSEKCRHPKTVSTFRRQFKTELYLIKGDSENRGV